MTYFNFNKQILFNFLVFFFPLSFLVGRAVIELLLFIFLSPHYFTVRDGKLTFLIKIILLFYYHYFTYQFFLVLISI